MKKSSISLVLLLVVALLVPGLSGCGSLPTVSASYKVSLDVNPSIELTVTDGLVSEVKAYNDDGAAITLDVAVLGMTAEAAVAAIVDEMVADGFILPTGDTTPYLLITVGEEAGFDPTVVAGLESAAMLAMEPYVVDCRVKSAVVSTDTQTAAGEADMSIGRYVLFSYIAQEMDMTLEAAIEAYVDYTMGELMDLFPDAETVFAAPEDDEGEPELDDPILEEPLPTLEDAWAQLMADLKVARDTFHTTFKGIKDVYKTELHRLHAARKTGDKVAIKAELTQVRKEMLAGRKAAILAFRDAMRIAKENFLAAAAELGIPLEEAEEYLEQDLDEDIDDDIEEPEFPEDDDEGEIEVQSVTTPKPSHPVKTVKPTSGKKK